MLKTLKVWSTSSRVGDTTCTCTSSLTGPLQRCTRFVPNLTCAVFRGTSLIRNCPPLGPYSRTMPRALWWYYGEWRFLRARYPCNVCLGLPGNVQSSHLTAEWSVCGCARTAVVCSCRTTHTLQVFLVHAKTRPPWRPPVGLCLGSYGGPRRGCSCS